MLRMGKKSGFTLMELLIVVCIIGLLVAVLSTSFSGASESAQAAKCKANLHNLAQAAISYLNDHGEMPPAESYEHREVTKGGQEKFREHNGWVSWTGRQNGHENNTSPGAGCSKPTCFAQSDSYDYTDPAYESITNGALWCYAADFKVYCCPIFASVCKNAGKTALRSYKMNPYFGISRYGYGSANTIREVRVRGLSKHGDAGTLLVFAEIPCYKPNSRDPEVGTTESAVDSFLHVEIEDNDYKVSTTGGKVGFNHRAGKRNVGHFAFADGHVEAIPEPRGATEGDLRDLAKYYCNGWELEEDLLKRIR